MKNKEEKVKPYSISMKGTTVKNLDLLIEMMNDKEKSRSNVIEGLVQEFIDRNRLSLEKYIAYKEEGAKNWEVQ